MSGPITVGMKIVVVTALVLLMGAAGLLLDNYHHRELALWVLGCTFVAAVVVAIFSVYTIIRRLHLIFNVYKALRAVTPHGTRIKLYQVPANRFNEEHLHVLSYVVDGCVANLPEGQFTIDRNRMRFNEKTHPQWAWDTKSIAAGKGWIPQYGTHLVGDFEKFDIRCSESDFDKAVAKGLVLPDHDDWDCLIDLQLAGFVNILSLQDLKVTITPMASKFLKTFYPYYQNGGNLREFKVKMPYI